MHQNPSWEVSNASSSDFHPHCVPDTEIKTKSQFNFNIICTVHRMINTL